MFRVRSPSLLASLVTNLLFHGHIWNKCVTNKIPSSTIQSSYMPFDPNLSNKKKKKWASVWKLCNFITSGHSAAEPVPLSRLVFIDPILPPPICSNKVMFIASRRKLKPCFMSCRYANLFTVQIDCGRWAPGPIEVPPIWNPNRGMRKTHMWLPRTQKKRKKKSALWQY